MVSNLSRAEQSASLSDRQPAPSMFRVLTGHVVMILNDIRIDRTTFSTPKPWAWLENHRNDVSFMRVLRTLMKRKLLDRPNLSIEHHLKSITHSEYLQLSVELQTPPSEATSVEAIPPTPGPSAPPSPQVESNYNVIINSSGVQFTAVDPAIACDAPIPSASSEVLHPAPEETVPIASAATAVEESTLVSPARGRVTRRQTAHRVYPTFMKSLKIQRIPVTTSAFNYIEGRKANDVFGLSSAFSGSRLEPRRLLSIDLGSNDDSPIPSNRIRRYYRSVKRGNLYDVLVYAPPHSGKSTFIASGKTLFIEGKECLGVYRDTDEMYSWKTSTSYVTLTNMPHLIARARYSVALVPSRSQFESRCRQRGLNPLPEWYTGMRREVSECDMCVFADDYMLDAFTMLSGTLKSAFLRISDNSRRSSAQ